MKVAQDKPTVEFEGVQIPLYPYLSYRILMQQRMIKPLLEALRAVDVKYRWGCPFKGVVKEIILFF